MKIPNRLTIMSMLRNAFRGTLLPLNHLQINSSGFTFIEFVIGAALVSILTVATMGFLADSQRYSYSIESQSEADAYFKEIVSYLASDKKCSAALGSFSTATLPVNISYLFDGNGGHAYEINQPEGRFNLQLTQIQLVDFKPLETDNGIERGVLDIKFDIQRRDPRSSSNITVPRNLNLIVMRDSARRISGCGSSSTDLWLKSPAASNEIYTNAPIGVGVSSPVAPLDIGSYPIQMGDLSTNGSRLIIESSGTDKIFRTTEDSKLNIQHWDAGTSSYHPTLSVYPNGHLGLLTKTVDNAMLNIRQEAANGSTLELNHGGSAIFTFNQIGSDLHLKNTVGYNSVTYGNPTPTNLVFYNKVAIGSPASAGSNIFYVGTGTAGGAGGWGGWVVASDRRLKKEIEPVQMGLQKLREMRPVTYRYKTDKKDQVRFGFIAQELEDIVPEVVDSSGTYKQVRLESLAGVLIEAIHEIKSQQDSLDHDLDQFISDVCSEDPNEEICHE